MIKYNSVSTIYIFFLEIYLHFFLLYYQNTSSNIISLTQITDNINQHLGKKKSSRYFTFKKIYILHQF